MELDQWIQVRIMQKKKVKLSETNIPMKALSSISSMQRTTKFFPVVEASMESQRVSLICRQEELFDTMQCQAQYRVHIQGVWIVEMDPIYYMDGSVVVDAPITTTEKEVLYTCELCGASKGRKEKSVHVKISFTSDLHVMTQTGIYTIDHVYVQNNTCYFHNKIDNQYIEMDAELLTEKTSTAMEIEAQKEIFAASGSKIGRLLHRLLCGQMPTGLQKQPEATIEQLLIEAGKREQEQGQKIILFPQR